MNIREEKHNELLNRKEIKVIVEAGKTPNMQEAGKIISDHFKSHEENIVIKAIRGKFGRNTFLISAFIYNTKKDKERTEPKIKKGKKGAEGKSEKVSEGKAEAKAGE